MIEGYCTTQARDAVSIGHTRVAGKSYGIPMSAAPGDRIDFHVSSDADYTLQFMRLRSIWDAGAGIDKLYFPLSEAALFRPPEAYFVTPDDDRKAPDDQPWQGYFWPAADHSLTVPRDWPSGYYAAYLRTADSDFYIPFVVTPERAGAFQIAAEMSRYRRFAMLASTLTWNCYNSAGGMSQYSQTQDPPPTLANPLILGFQRPFPFCRPCPPFPAGTEEEADFNSKHTLRADLWLTTWLEDHGYEVDLFTDLDLHFKTFNPANYAGLILGTHPEYWTDPMRDHLDTYMGLGGSLIYLGGNGLFERVELSDTDTWQVSVSGWGSTDPGKGHAGELDTSRWLFRRPPPLADSRPERELLGVSYPGQGSDCMYQVNPANVNHRLLANANAGAAPFGAIGIAGRYACGWETDTSNEKDADYADGGALPVGLTVLAEGTIAGNAQMVTYDTDAHGLVYSVGSINYGQSLARGDEVLETILKNVLDECRVASVLRHHPEIAHWVQIVAREAPPFGRPKPPGPVEIGALAERALDAMVGHGNLEGIRRGLKAAGYSQGAAGDLSRDQ